MAPVILRQKSQQAGQLVLIIGAGGTIINLLQEHNIGIFSPDHPGHLPERLVNVRGRGALIRTGLIG